LITFAFITNGLQDILLEQSILSITQSSISEYEILVIGNTKLKDDRIRIIGFDEDEKVGWITRKKNLVAQESIGSVLVIMHDYIMLGSGWNNEFAISLENSIFDVGICEVHNFDGSRFRDWVLWPFNHRILERYFRKTKKLLLPYRCKHLTSLQYISGSVIFCKKEFLLKNPFDEKLSWGEGEDVEWSCRLRAEWNLQFFDNAIVKCGKKKDVIFKETDFFSLSIVRIYLFILKFLPKSLQKFLSYEMSLRTFLKSLFST
jgi:hypothetical protein